MTAKALATMGWRTNTSARLTQAIRDFQTGWNLGPALAIDGQAGPATRNAIQVSMARRAAGLPDFSEHFNAAEFACNCGGAWADCRRIWITRETVRVAEQWRTLVGPFTPDRGCRCPRENKRVNGVTNSQHLNGRALDVPVYLITVAQARALKSITGIGYYRVTMIGGRRYDVVRHVDTRHSATAAAPATWEYGTYKGTPRTPRPDAAKPAPPVTPQPERSWFDMATKEDLRAVVREEIAAAFADEARWRRVLTGMAFFKDPTTPNRGESPDEPRIPLGRLMEIAGIAALEAKDVPQESIRDAVADAIKSIDVTVRTDTQGE